MFKRLAGIETYWTLVGFWLAGRSCALRPSLIKGDCLSFHVYLISSDTSTRYTLVQYYTDAQKVVRELDAELKAYVPLEPSGTLDLQKVNQEWGLENCIVSQIITLPRIVAERLVDQIVDPLDDTRIRIPPDGFLPADIVKLQNLRYGSVMVIGTFSSIHPFPTSVLMTILRGPDLESHRPSTSIS